MNRKWSLPRHSAVSDSSTTVCLETVLTITRKLAGSWTIPLPSNKKQFPWLKEVDSLSFANAQIRLNKAYNNFLRNRKHFGKLRFKSKKTARLRIPRITNGFVRIEGHKVKLPKVGLSEIVSTSSTDGEKHHKNCNHKQDTNYAILHQFSGWV